MAETQDTGLSLQERDLLETLGRDGYVQYCECYGATLTALLMRGFAVVHGPGEHQESFIAKGTSRMHRAVSLTEVGRAMYRMLPRALSLADLPARPRP